MTDTPDRAVRPITEASAHTGAGGRADQGRRPAAATGTPSTGNLGMGAGRQKVSGRAEHAADRVAALIGTLPAGSRLGTKEELRMQCEVSVGTFNEALRLLQSRGLVTVKPGPGGGLFSAEQTLMVRLGNSVLALDAQHDDVANAVRIRDALDPLLVEDALWHASPADVTGLRQHVTAMEQAMVKADPVAFVQANWRLHASIAAISPNTLLSSLYTSLLDLIESHTLSVLPISEQPLGEYITQRYELHRDLVESLDRRDRDGALRLIHEHNTNPASTRVHEPR